MWKTKMPKARSNPSSRIISTRRLLISASRKSLRRMGVAT